MGKRKGATLGTLFCANKKIPLQPQSNFKKLNPLPSESQVVRVSSSTVPVVMDQFWSALCGDLNVPESIASQWLGRITERYSRPARSYHNLEVMFLTHKLPHLKQAKDSALALASTFQYLEYRPKTDLTQENCDLFREFAAEAGLNANQPIVVGKVLRLLGAPTNQDEEEKVTEAESNFFQDLDLAVLGSSESEYANYRKLLREEFPELTDEAYKAMRLKVLQSFQMIPVIYCSEAFANLEFTARANIEKEIAELTGN